MGTNITVNSQGIADVKIDAVQLRQVLQSYELMFLISGTLFAQQEGVSRWLVVHGAYVALQTNAGLVDLPLAHVDQPVIIRQTQYPGTCSLQLRVNLHPHQLAALEAVRNGGNLDFQLRLAARGGDSQRGANDWPEQPTLAVHVPESSWVAQLESAKALRVLLLEIPMPISGAPGRAADKHLIRAQQHYIDGNYRECVSECRQFAEELGGSRLAAALTKLKNDRMNMSKDERQTAILASLQNYAHLAAHSSSEGGVDYNRADAAFALSVAAALAAHPET